MTMADLITCYNKGCGQKYNPNENDDEKCQFHPGQPVFHDAYKGWSCCNKKSTDFTEFLNFKGCTQGKHSNVKPAEPEKPKQLTEEEIEEQIRKQNEKSNTVETVERPPFEDPCTILEPFINPSFKKQMDELDLTKKLESSSIDGCIAIGTTCKNSGCKGSYLSPASNDDVCVYHPGFPIFHEGYKFWTCCQKKTSDFQAFLDQAGCETGKHKWIKDVNVNSINCRWDWHQTANNVVVAVYAKNYDYKKSFVKLNPIRLTVKLVFPLENHAEFNMDLELRGIVDVEKSSAKMFGTKIEITMQKLQGGQWIKLDFPRETPKEEPPKESSIEIEKNNDKPAAESNDDNDSDVDLDDLELVHGAKISELAAQSL
ncbi:cysteine and histidine-rich domain-containing protein morgana [Chironomus tepperi]|uniref:cysteine and histidine-rich domain-containing protein morgana n=1 Tax=Chironomus tepperi TaxID=113505 RepID=UPI00391FA8B9